MMPYLLFLKKHQNLKLSSAANYRWRFKGLKGLRLPGLLASVLVLLFDQSLKRLHTCISAKTRSDRDKLCHFWSKMK